MDSLVNPKKFSDYTGFRSGKVTVLGFDSWHYQPSGQRKSKWLCICDCGTEFTAIGANLKKKNHTTSCGCEKKKNVLKYWESVNSGLWVPTNLNNKRFGRLLVKGFVRWDTNSSGARVSVWDTLCDCGNSHTVRVSNLTESSSCGCWFREKAAERSTTHGMTGTPTYVSWSKMKERCDLESYAEKEYYQDKGITYDIRWKSFENFLEDMGERPEGKTLDRIDGSLGYSKDNCRWSDLTIQAYNRSKRSTNTSGRTGVYEMQDGSYQAIIGYYGDRIVLASGVSFEEACRVREEAEIEYYGEVKE